MELHNTESLYLDRWSGDRFVVERLSSDGYYAIGRREFFGSGEFEPWTARVERLKDCYILGAKAVVT